LSLSGLNGAIQTTIINYTEIGIALRVNKYVVKLSIERVIQQLTSSIKSVFSEIILSEWKCTDDYPCGGPFSSQKQRSLSHILIVSQRSLQGKPLICH
jgi:uncharacterized protein YlzI (FlbEa/FlbD family)